MQSRVREEARTDLACDQHKLSDAVTGNHRRQLSAEVFGPEAKRENSERMKDVSRSCGILA